MADNVLSLSDLCFPHLYEQMIGQNNMYLIGCLALCLACGQCSDVVFWYLFLLIVIDLHGYVQGGTSLKPPTLLCDPPQLPWGLHHHSRSLHVWDPGCSSQPELLLFCSFNWLYKNLHIIWILPAAHFQSHFQMSTFAMSCQEARSRVVGDDREQESTERGQLS